MQNGNGIHYLPEFDNSVPLGDKISYIEDYKDEIPALLFAAKVADEEVCGRLKDDLEKDGVDIGAMVDENDANVFHYIAKNDTHGKQILALFEPSQYRSKINEEDGNNETAITIALRADNFDLAVTLHDFLNKSMTWSPSLLYYCLVRFDVYLMAYVLMKDPTLIGVGYGKRGKDEILSAAVQYRDLVTCRSMIDCFSIEYLKQGTYWLEHGFLYDAAFNKKHGQEIARFLLNNYEFDLEAHPEEEEDVSYSPLVNALTEEHVGVAEELFNHGADIKVKIYGENLLQFCVEENKLESASFLHRKDEEIIRHLGPAISPIVNLADMSGESPLHAALSEGKLEVAEALIENGADMNVKLDGNNLLLFCVVKNKLESAQFVHAKDGSQIHGIGKNGKTAREHVSPNSEIYKWLLEEGGVNPEGEEERTEDEESNGTNSRPEFDNSASLEDKLAYIKLNRGGIPALLFAAQVADEEVCGRLKNDLEEMYGVDIGTMVDENGANVFHYIAKNATHGEDILALFDQWQYRSKVNEEDGNNETAITIALRANNFQLACKLHKYLNTKTTWTPSIFYYCLVRYDFSLMEYVSKKDSTLIGVGDGKRNKDEILSAAVQYRDLATCKSIIDCFSIGYLKQGTHWNDLGFLYDAVFNKKHGQEITQFLLTNYKFDLERKEEINEQPNFYYHLFFALMEEHVGVAEELLNHGSAISPMVNLADMSGKTPLHVALSEGKLEVAEALIENGADMNNQLESVQFVHAKDRSQIHGTGKNGRTTVQLARVFASPKIEIWLLKELNCVKLEKEVYRGPGKSEEEAKAKLTHQFLACKK
ncbi:uncharacterized protein LOC135942293 [Cloeon dipterum]|uniref:uncharacterized protein LOC135942293 n=1 Tax=Cloeon dipterum TaxID=197152 RepID=UPI0032202699